MKRLLLIALLLAGAGSQAIAALGETLAEVEARYGKPVTVENGRTGRESKRFYKHDGYRITVRFLDGKSHFEEYTKEDLANMAISDDEMKALLMKNCLGLEWTRLRSTQSDPMMEKNWELNIPDRTVAVASSKFPYGKLTVATAEYVHYNSDFEKPPKERAEPAEP